MKDDATQGFGTKIGRGYSVTVIFCECSKREPSRQRFPTSARRLAHEQEFYEELVESAG
jgi:hypothetical protein